MQYQMDSLPSFDLTRDAAGEKFQTWVLNSSPLQNTLPQKVLYPYLKQGCLAPQQLEPCSASPCRLASFESRASSLNVPASSGLPLRSLVPSALGSQPPTVSPSTGLPSTIDTIYDLSTSLLPDPPLTRPSSDFLPSGQSTVGPGIESPEAFFTAALGRSEEERVKRRSKEERVKERVKLLVDVVEGFSKAKERPDGLHKSFWSRWPPIFGSEPELGSEAESTSKTFEARYTDRLRRLKQIRHGIPKEDWQTSRLWLICVAHEIEHISQWEGIDAYTSRGVDRRSAAINIVAKHLERGSSNLLKRCNNIVYLMAVGGPAAVLLDNGARSRNVWEREMTLDDMTFFYRFKRDRLPQTKSHDPDAAHAIRGCFLRYGWSSSELLSSSTEVMEILGPYLTGAGPGDSDTNKGQRQPGASASCPDHEFSLDQFTPGSIDQATSSGIDNTHLISFDARNWTRNLTDPATRGNLDYALNSSGELTDPATADNLGYAIDSSGEITIPATADDLGYAIDSSDEITDPATRSNLDYAFNRGEFTAGRQNNRSFKCDQCLKSFKRNQDLKRHKRIHLAVKPFPCENCQRRFPRKDALKIHVLRQSCVKNVTNEATADDLGYTINNSGEITDQSMNALSNFDNEMDPYVVELFQWTVNGSDALTDPATDTFLQEAIPAEELYLMNNSIYPSHDQDLPNATPGCIRSTDNEQSDDSWHTG